MCIRCCPIKQNARNLLKFRPLKFEVIAAFFFLNAGISTWKKKIYIGVIYINGAEYLHYRNL